MKKIIMVIGGGGFLFQSLSLLKKIVHSYQINIIIPSDSEVLKTNILESINVPLNISSLPSVTTFSLNRTTQFVNFIKCFLLSIKNFLKDKPDVVIVVASSMAVPLFLAAKVYRVKTIFIDSITRVDQPSKTGLLISRFKLADRFYVQWPEAVKMYPSAIYKGTVL